MGQPVLCREKELGAIVNGDMKTTNIADMSPAEQAKWAIKYGLDLDKINGRIVQSVTDEEESADHQRLEQPKELTKETYIQLKEQKMSDSEIRKMFGIKSPNRFTSWKEENGLKGYQLKLDTSSSAVINPNTDIRFKKETAEPTRVEKQDDTVIKSLEDELAKKDEELQKYQSLLYEANQARLNAEAKAETLVIELQQNHSNKKQLDLRPVVALLMSTGNAAVETFEEFRTLIEVLGKMKMAWIANHDTYKFNIETAP